MTSQNKTKPQFDKDFEEAVKKVTSVLRTAPRPEYISNSQLSYIPSHVADQIEMVLRNWDNSEVWDASEMCW